MKKVILMFLGFALSHIAFADQNDFRCLQSIHLQKPIRLQFNFPQDTQETSSVTYSTSKESIPIKLKSTKTLDEGPVGRPSLFQYVWEEMPSTGSGGKYILSSQGALIGDFKYVRSDGKVFRFEVNTDASTENGCKW